MYINISKYAQNTFCMHKINISLSIKSIMASKLVKIASIGLICTTTLGGFEIGSRIHERNQRLYAREYERYTSNISQGIYGAKEERAKMEEQWGPESYLGTIAPFLHWSIFGCLTGLGILGIKKIITENLKESRECNARGLNSSPSSSSSNFPEENSRDRDDCDKRDDDYCGRSSYGAMTGTGGY